MYRPILFTLAELLETDVVVQDGDALRASTIQSTANMNYMDTKLSQYTITISTPNTNNMDNGRQNFTKVRVILSFLSI